MLKRFISGMLTVFFACVAFAPPSAFAKDEFPIPSGFTSAYRTIDGVKLHYVEGGTGPLVLLVHGFGQTWYAWHQLMPLLAKNFTVVAPDLPGLGMSEAPKNGYAGQQVSDYLYKLAKHFSPNEKFNLVAHDIGIWLTYPMAIEHNAEIRKVVFMEAPIPSPRMYTFPAFSPQGESLVWHFSFFAAGDRLPETLITGKEKFFFSHFIKAHATNTTVFTDALLNMYAKSYSKPASLHSAFEYYRAINTSIKQNAELSKVKLTMPVLAIGGGGNGGFGQFETDELKLYATNVQGSVLPDCGHWLPEECAATLNPLVVSFLKRN